MLNSESLRYLTLYFYSTASFDVESLPFNMQSQTYSNHFVEALIRESEKDEDIVVVHAGMAMEPSFQMLKSKLQHKFFDVGMAEQHAVTFSAGLSRGGMKPFCIIPSAFLQRAFDQVVTPSWPVTSHRVLHLHVP